MSGREWSLADIDVEPADVQLVQDRYGVRWTPFVKLFTNDSAQMWRTTFPGALAEHSWHQILTDFGPLFEVGFDPEIDDGNQFETEPRRWWEETMVDRAETGLITIHDGNIERAGTAVAEECCAIARDDNGTITIVFTRPKLLFEDEIMLDFDGAPHGEHSTGVKHFHPGATTLAEAQGAHMAWLAWREADVNSQGPLRGKPTVTREQAETLRSRYESIVAAFGARPKGR